MNRFSVLRVMVLAVAVSSSLWAVQSFARPAESDVSFVGLVTCSHCLDLAQHKGFTPWSWAMYQVSRGDNIVLVTDKDDYYLEGDRQDLVKYIGDRVTVTGRLNNLVTGHVNNLVIEVTNIVRPQKVK